MAKDKKNELKQLKRDYFKMEETRREEREALFKVINTFGVVAAMQEDIAEDIETIKEVISREGELPFKQIDLEIRKLKDKIITLESNKSSLDTEPGQLPDFEERTLEACKIIKRISWARSIST